MKLIIGGKVYLQKYEIVYLAHNLNSFPSGVIDEVFGDDNIFIMNGLEDGFKFERAFTRPENVKWLTEQGWILDFEEYAKMSLPELEAIQDRLKTERSAGISEFNEKDISYREQHFNEVNDRFKKLGHKAVSIGYLIDFLGAEVKFGFPKEYKGSFASTPAKKPGFLARLFNHGAH